jgi:nucleotide-binding universal stress UspA family protein
VSSAAPINAILVGVDGSPESKNAVAFASRLALHAGAKVLLVYCVAPLATLESISLRAYLSAEREFGDGVLRELEAQLTSTGVANERLLVDGNPAGRLAELAQERDVDLVVVGHSGRGAVHRLLVGSVTSRLSATSPKPLLIVR